MDAKDKVEHEVMDEIGIPATTPTMKKEEA